MNNLRKQVIHNIMSGLYDVLPEDEVDKVYDRIVIELDKVELTERSTELSLVDDTSEKILKRFIATKRIEGSSESTLKRYYYEIHNLLYYYNKPIQNYTTDDLRFYLSWRRQVPNRKQLSNRTLDGMRRIYCSFFGWLAAEQIISYNPTLTLKSIKYKRVVRKPFTAVELQRLREACTNIRDLALIDYLYCTGCRVSEVVNTDIDSVDFDSLECVVTGKGNKERRVYITPVCAMHLKQYLDSRNDIDESLFVGLKTHKRLSKIGIEMALRKIGERANVTNVHPHRFRRTLCSDLYARGMDILDIAQILGHEDISTTKIYCYVNPKSVKSCYQDKMCA